MNSQYKNTSKAKTLLDKRKSDRPIELISSNKNHCAQQGMGVIFFMQLASFSAEGQKDITCICALFPAVMFDMVQQASFLMLFL